MAGSGGPQRFCLVGQYLISNLPLILDKMTSDAHVTGIFACTISAAQVQ